MPYHYLALQFSGIQKAILRHGRLWSLSGISQIMQEVNEVDLPGIVDRHGGTVLLAGGGKFTASFPDKTPEIDLETLKTEIRLHISSTLPMLEYQLVTHSAPSLLEATRRPESKQSPPNMIQKLADEKRSLRGYSVSHNPHFEVCEECGEYPVTFVKEVEREDGKQVEVRWCGFCKHSFTGSKFSLSEIWKNRKSDSLTSIQRVYAAYLNADPQGHNIPRNFEYLFSGGRVEGRRIAAWLSDTNNMGDIVPLWMAQDDLAIKKTLNRVRESNIAIVANALRETFPLKKMPENWLPFRIIIAGGDDLCVVMDENYILNFAMNFAAAHNDLLARAQKEVDHPLNETWLRQKAKDLGKPDDYVKPFCFAGCFIVTSLHTPFKRVHDIGEGLLKKAKEKSGRAANSVTWRIMAEDEETVAEKLLKNMEKPVFFNTKPAGFEISGHLSFKELSELQAFYKEELSGSHMQMVAGKMLSHPDDPVRVQRELEILASADTPRSFGRLLVDKHIAPEGQLRTGRLASLLELTSIEGDS